MKPTNGTAATAVADPDTRARRQPPITGTPPTVRDVVRWLKALIDPDQVVELRVPKVHIELFDAGRLAELAGVALKYSGQVPGVYFTLNPVAPHLAGGRRSAKDTDITHRRRLLIDCDPQRPPDTSATDAEKAEALATASAIRDFLTSLEFPAPIEGDSGNGGHLVYAIDLPNDDASRDLIRAVLRALAARFNSPAVAIDTSVYNASRICKLYGTEARKGTPTAERPHRFSHVLKVPKSFTEVPRERLEGLAATPSPTTSTRPRAGGRAKPAEGTTISLSAIVDRARKYLAACPPAVSGKGGHNQTLKAARVGPGFDLPPDDAFALLRDEYNPRCEPPWTEAELGHKNDEAYKNAEGRGFLLKESHTRISSSHNGNGVARRGVDGPPPDGPGGPRQTVRRDDTPVILISTDEHIVIDKAVAALAVDNNVYQRANSLMTILRDTSGSRRILRPPGSPRIANLPTARLRELLTKNARWEKSRQTRDGDVESIPAHPPDWAVAGVASRGEWPEIRPIEAITETPVLRHDGTILDRPGYDDRTGLLYEPNAVFPPIPTRPTQDDARKSAAELLALVVDFPFARIKNDKGGDDEGKAHRAAWLAALLTPLARFAVAGPCPLFLIEASTPGTGKSLLTDIIALTATNRDMPRTSYPDSDEEMRKRITSIALAGDRLMLLDNIATTFGGSALDSALTARTWRDRLLSRSEMTADLPLFTVWYATGNNVTLRGDAVRRVVPCRLETMEERPEERSNFTIKGDLLEHARHERPRLVRAALTLLLAHSAAGRPGGGLTPFGSFEAWSSVVRSAVHWSTGFDPCLTREELRKSDPDAIARAALLEGWTTLKKGRVGVSATDALEEVKTNMRDRSLLREALMHFSRNDDLPSAKSLSMRLAALRGRVVEGKVLRSKAVENHILHWFVEFTGREG